ncbi:hypothetical protein H5410_015330 [Solanum commersonii]|uniref:Uncharacterized protein n=1 Tax=Solanum commersonii TaxID=4109 RepID=A0A9J5ZU24_SOLCO|nr:hypothetical protein H5410_015330 [Solanum commersonii]
MCKLRDTVDDLIWWRTGKGNIRFWFDNWTTQGQLYFLMEDFTIYQDVNVNEVFKKGVWDWAILIPHPNDYIKEIIARFPTTINQNKEDITVWTVSELEAFTVSSARESVRQMRNISQFDSRLWYDPKIGKLLAPILH